MCLRIKSHGRCFHAAGIFFTRFSRGPGILFTHGSRGPGFFFTRCSRRPNILFTRFSRKFSRRLWAFSLAFLPECSRSPWIVSFHLSHSIPKLWGALTPSPSPGTSSATSLFISDVICDGYCFFSMPWLVNSYGHSYRFVMAIEGLKSVSFVAYRFCSRMLLGCACSKMQLTILLQLHCDLREAHRG